MWSIILIVLSCFVLSILTHEFGHSLAHKVFTGKWLRIRPVRAFIGFRVTGNVDSKLTEMQYRRVLASGIIAGLFWPGVYAGLFGDFMFLMYLPMVYGSIDDFVKIQKSMESDPSGE